MALASSCPHDVTKESSGDSDVSACVLRQTLSIAALVFISRAASRLGYLGGGDGGKDRKKNDKNDEEKYRESDDGDGGRLKAMGREYDDDCAEDQCLSGGGREKKDTKGIECRQTNKQTDATPRENASLESSVIDLHLWVFLSFFCC